MPDYDFSHVDCVLYEPEANIRRLVRDVLGTLKLNRVHACETVSQLRAALQAGAGADLVIADCAAADGEVLGIFVQLRNGAFGGNPFCGLIGTAFTPTQQLLVKVTNSGADALLVKPVAPRQIRDRIVGLVEAARNFVVTADYVGPDRRKGPREGGQAQLVEVPNTLRLKVTGTAAKVNLHELVEAASAEVNERKLERMAFQAAFLIAFARPGLAARTHDRLAFEHLGRVPALLNDLAARIPGHAEGKLPHASALAQTIVAAAEQARRSVAGGMPVDLGPLLVSVAELVVEVAPARDREAIIAEVEAATAAYRERIERFIQARAAAAAAAEAAPAADAAAGAEPTEVPSSG
ncbi:response regulator transcription factor [Arenibaculum pallidiluteum]|uniref:response regulator transcription factor n=1 Tax=Arenibaculum pallidiluteum TaxID=2812559 RepID=UPI001A966A60|nr:response regulator transcription factor [Arenibaculum pallidiluteum]